MFSLRLRWDTMKTELSLSHLTSENLNITHSGWFSSLKSYTQIVWERLQSDLCIQLDAERTRKLASFQGLWGMKDLRGHLFNTHPFQYMWLEAGRDKGDWTTRGSIILSIDFSCWVLQRETVGLSGHDLPALLLTKRVFPQLIWQRAYY